MSDTSTIPDVTPYGWPRWLSVRTAALYAGQIDEGSIRRLISAGKLTAHRILKGRIAVDRLELDALAEAATTTPRLGRGRHR